MFFDNIWANIEILIIQCYLNLEKAISTVPWFLGDRIRQSYTLEFSPFVKIKKKYCWTDQEVQLGFFIRWYRNLNELLGHPIPGLLRWH